MAGNFGADEVTGEEALGTMAGLTMEDSERAAVIFRDSLRDPDRSKNVAGNYTTHILQASGALPEDMSTADRNMVRAFFQGTKYIDTGDGNTRRVEVKDLERIEGFDSYNFGFGLTSIDALARDQRKALVADRDPAANPEIEAAILAVDAVRRLGLNSIGQSLTAGQSSEAFRGIADALTKEDVSAGQLESVIDRARRSGMDEDEIASLLSGIEIDYDALGDGDFGTGVDTDVTADELSSFLDMFGTIDDDLKEIEQERMQADRVAGAARSEARAQSAIDLAAELAAIRDPESDINKRIAEIGTELETAGMVTADDIEAIEAEIEEAEKESDS